MGLKKFFKMQKRGHSLSITWISTIDGEMFTNVEVELPTANKLFKFIQKNKVAAVVIDGIAQGLCMGRISRFGSIFINK